MEYSVTARTPPKEMSRYVGILKGQTRSQINTFTKTDGGFTDPGKESLDTLIQTHFPTATENTNMVYDLNGKIKSS